KCSNDIDCPYKGYLNHNKCWGYEYDCKWDRQYSTPACPGDHKGWADFGFVKQQLEEMKVFCEPLFPDDSSLECSEHLRFCQRSRLDTKWMFKRRRYRGYCDFYKDKLNEQADHISPLQSWGPEMRYFTKLTRRPMVEGDCDVIIEKPTFIMKIDAIVNM
ncbi:hypothetical protein NQ318_010631, partial [Aromia moschata]